MVGLFAFVAWRAWSLVAGLRRFSQLEECHDKGGCWIESEGRCEYAEKSPCNAATP